MSLLIFTLLGLAFGSFINALVWRVHRQEELESKSLKKITKSKSKTPNYSIINGRSVCPKCHHQLAVLDLIPIFSWLTLKGKCRYCHKPISWQYPLVEIITAVLFVISLVFWPFELNELWHYINFATWLVALTGLIALAVYDLKWMLLPDKIVIPLFLFVLTSVGVQISLGRDYQDLWQIAVAMLIGGGFFWFLYQISAGKWIGGGDVKLGFLLGLVLVKPAFMVLCIFLASLAGTLLSLPLVWRKKLQLSSKLPFGPLLIGGAIVAMLFGQKIVDWYLSFMAISI